MSILGLILIWGTVIVRSFVRDIYKVIPADEVARTEARWLNQVANVRPVPRELETTPANKGLAESVA